MCAADPSMARVFWICGLIDSSSAGVSLLRWAPNKSRTRIYRKCVSKRTRMPAYFHLLRLIGIVIGNQHQRAIRVFESHIQHFGVCRRIDAQSALSDKLGVLAQRVIFDSVFHFSGAGL